MQEFKRESDFIKYLQQLGVNISSEHLALDELSFYTWKSEVVVEKPERFLEISKKLSIEELVIGRGGSLFFDMKVPIDSAGSYWSVTLKSRYLEDFLQKYKKEYREIRTLT